MHQPCLKTILNTLSSQKLMLNSPQPKKARCRRTGIEGRDTTQPQFITATADTIPAAPPQAYNPGDLLANRETISMEHLNYSSLRKRHWPSLGKFVRNTWCSS